MVYQTNNLVIILSFVMLPNSHGCFLMIRSIQKGVSGLSKDDRKNHSFSMTAILAGPKFVIACDRVVIGLSKVCQYAATRLFLFHDDSFT